MKIVIVGVGKVGVKLVEVLSKENHDIVIVDTNMKTVELMANKFDVLGVVGGGSNRETLLEAGVDKADFFISCTNRDELNIVCCVLAKKLGSKYTIARVRDPEYVKETHTIKEDLGIDMVFNPEFRTASEIARILKFPSAINIESFADGRALMIEFHIESGNPVIGKTVMETVKEYSSNVLFALIKRGDESIIPRGDFEIKEDDDVFIIGNENEIALFSKKMKIFKPSCKSVFIIGGGKVGFYLAQKLISSGTEVKILEKSEARCNELSENLPQATILLGDGSEQEILDEEKFFENDACVTLTGLDEQNVIISLYADQRGVGKVITKVDRPSVMDMTKVLGLDTVLSPREIIASHILRFIRSRQSVTGKGVRSLYRISENVEALEFSVNEHFGAIDVPVREMKIKEEAIIAGIIRGNEYIRPSGESVINVGDKVLVVTVLSGVTDLNQILK